MAKSLPRSESRPMGAQRLRLAQAWVFYGVLLVIAIIWSYSQAGSELFFPYLTTEDLALSLLFGVLGALAVVAISAVLPILFSWARSLEKRFAALLTPLNVSHIVVLALLSGFCEEIFFRGTMQPAFGYVPASLIFALAHFIPSRKWIAWFFLTFPVGLFLGYLFEVTGNLWGCITCHTLINGINLSLINMKYQGRRGQLVDTQVD